MHAVLPKDTAPHRGNRDQYPRLLSAKSQAIVKRALRVYGAYNSDVGTPRVVAARELVVLSALFTSHALNVSEVAPSFMWTCEPRKIHSLQC